MGMSKEDLSMRTLKLRGLTRPLVTCLKCKKLMRIKFDYVVCKCGEQRDLKYAVVGSAVLCEAWPELLK